MHHQGKLEAYQTAPPSAAEAEVDWILEEVKRGELTFEEAESCFQELLDHIPHPETDAPGASFSELAADVELQGQMPLGTLSMARQ